MSDETDDPVYDRRSSWAQYQVYVMAELKSLARQGDKIEAHLLELVHKVNGKFTEIENRFDEGEKEIERLKTKATVASAVVGAIVSSLVSASAFFFGRR